MINILSKNAFQLINCFFKAAGRPMRVRHATLDVGLDDGVPDCLPEEAGLSGVLVSADSKFALPTWPITIMLTADLLFLSLQDSTSGPRKATFQAASSSGIKLSTLIRLATVPTHPFETYELHAPFNLFQSILALEIERCSVISYLDTAVSKGR